MALIIDTIETSEGLDALGPEWEALEKHATPRLPFHTFLWSKLWFENFAESGSAVRDRLSVRALRTTRGELVAVAPFVITERPSRGPLRARILQPMGADPYVTEVRGVLCHPDHEDEAFVTLAAQLRLEHRQWDWFELGGVRQGSKAHQALAGKLSAEITDDVPDFFLALTPTWEEFKAGLSRNMKESLRKAHNAPKRDGLDLQLRVMTTAGESVERFLALHAARATATDTVFHTDVFQSSQAKGFLRAYTTALAARGELFVFELVSAGEVVASRLGFLLGDALYLYFSGYRLDMARYSVMTRTVAEAIQWAIGRGLKTVNLSTGMDVSKTRWNPTEVIFLDLLAVSPAPSAQWVRRGYLALDSALKNPALIESPVGRVLQRLRRRTSD